MNKITKMRLITMAFLTLMLSSCNVFDNEQVVGKELIGKWQWEQSSGGFAGQVIYADSVNYTMQLDLRTAQAFWFHNGKLISEYNIERGKDELKGKLIMRPVSPEQDGSIVRIIQEVENGNLVLTDQCIDCYSYLFRR